MSDVHARIQELKRSRPRSRLVRASALVFALGAAGAWLSGEIAAGELITTRRFANLERFLAQDARPDADGPAELFSWAAGVLVNPGFEASVNTLSIAWVALVLAALFALCAQPFATRTLMRSEPYGSTRDLSVRSVAAKGLRVVFVLMRAVPEYVWAFLLLAILGRGVWPVVLALALHNGGILSKLGGELLEDSDSRAPRALAGLGAARLAIYGTALLPATRGRFLLFFFYRLETCVREATVLGLLGVVSLGYWIQDARSRLRYDEMLLLAALGVGMVLVVDLTSQAIRKRLRTL